VRTSKVHIPLLIASLAVLSACNPTKRVPQGEYLLVKNTIRSDAAELGDPELAAILKQKANNKVLGQRLYLHLYNLSSPEKTAIRQAEVDSACTEKNARRAERTARRNAKRTEKGKPPKKARPKECRRTLRVWLREDVGEPPVVLDSSLIARSVDQLKLYLNKEGYFNATVSDTVRFTRTKLFSGKPGKPFKRPKAAVEYVIHAGEPYTLCTTQWTVDDPAIDSLIQAASENSLVAADMRFDGDVLDKERTRLNDLMRQHGYLYFNRDLLQYVADTSAGDHQVDLLLRVERPLSRGRRGLQGTPEGTVYTLENITVDMSARPRPSEPPPATDTVTYKGYDFLFSGEKPKYRPKALSTSLQLEPGERYSQTANDRTYRRLTNLRVFDRVDITYDTTYAQGPDLADCNITVLPSKRQNLSLEGFLTNRGGFAGTSVSFGYRHRNLFRSMGLLQVQMSVGLEAQQRLGGNGEVDDAGLGVGRDVFFNTVELGPEVTVQFPRFLIPFPRRLISVFNRNFKTDDELWPRTWGRRTSVNILYNYQRRPDYTRTLAKTSFGYEWNKKGSLTWALYPVEIDFIHIPALSDAFLDFIQTSNDAILRDSYTDHVVAGGRASVTLKTPGFGPNKRNVFFWRPTVQTSGNLLRLVNNSFDLEQQTDTAGNSFYTFGGVRFAQFVKVENDMRYYHAIHAKSSVAFRIDAGVGVPYGNLDVLPFESSFFGGGANNQRAWRARSLGPGSYNAPLDAFDRVGEITIGGNAEYRFKLIDYLEGALFCDIGNIWDIHENPAKPGSGFELEKFAGELAVGTGIGARLNFDFFLVRFDLGLQTKDPSLPIGERWIFQPKPPERTTPFGNKLTFNLGIGYPF
jgi:outer membrane protein assembly factor BamA